jgi:hypothetical protein
VSADDQELKDLGWTILELMGHRRLGGLVREDTLAGAKVLRVEIPDGDGFTTQFYGGGALYCVTPTTEELARAVAARNRPAPVHRWELPAAPPQATVIDDDDCFDHESAGPPHPAPEDIQW